MNKIKLMADPDLGILTFQNLSSESHKGVPDNWLRCFICRDEAETLPDYNRILFLRNVNIRPMASLTESSPVLPIWHAAVILLDDDEPKRLLLIKETAMLDYLSFAIPYLQLIKYDFPDANVSHIRVEMDDADEVPEETPDGRLTNIPISVLKGWPTETSRQLYLRTQEKVNEIAFAKGKEATTGFTYVVETEHLDMSLQFTYCMVAQKRNWIRFIADDILCAEEAW